VPHNGLDTHQSCSEADNLRHPEALHARVCVKKVCGEAQHGHIIQAVAVVYISLGMEYLSDSTYNGPTDCHQQQLLPLSSNLGSPKRWHLLALSRIIPTQVYARQRLLLIAIKRLMMQRSICSPAQ
jgi:hypothetical protein